MWLFHHNNGGPCVPTQPVTIYTTCDHKLVSKPVTVDKELTHLPFQQIVKPLTFFFDPSLAPPLPGSSSSCILVPFQLYILSRRVAIVFLQDGRCICAGWLMYLCKRHGVFHHKVNGKIFLGLGRMYDGCSAVFCIELEFWAPLLFCLPMLPFILKTLFSKIEIILKISRPELGLSSKLQHHISKISEK